MGNRWKINTDGKKTNEEYSLDGLDNNRVYLSLVNMYAYAYIENNPTWFTVGAWSMDTTFLNDAMWHQPGTERKFAFYAKVYTNNVSYPAGVRLYDVDVATALYTNTNVIGLNESSYVLSGEFDITYGNNIRVEFATFNNATARCYLSRAGIYLLNKK